mgnify:CR=1 FL=1
MDRMDLNCYNSRLEINLSRIGRNIDKIRAYTGGLGLIPVVKSNAYGYGTAAVANFLAGSVFWPLPVSLRHARSRIPAVRTAGS